MNQAGCAMCGRPVSHRIDLTYSEVDPKDTGSYTIQSVLRGTLVCSGCMTTKTVGELVAQAAGGVAIVRGCLVQCLDSPPWWLRRVRPSTARIWSKVICPNCKGRASVQFVGDAVERVPRLFDWAGGLGQAIRIMSWRRIEEHWDDEMDSGGSSPVPDSAQDDVARDRDRGVPGTPVAALGTADDDVAMVTERPEGTDRSSPDD